ncbi:MAG: type II secretion system major pseudopilin GspG [Candidatus Omnitrophica bacterium]|nr:type II secretion system major pseudopilin GspG [Candidatus Omnitrophota bacterium]
MKNQKGFTFIEIMAVMIIIGIIAALIMPRIFSRIEDAKVTAAKVQIKNFEDALKLFYLDNNFYPSTEQGLSALVQKPTTGDVPEHWRTDGYLETLKVPLDPWGNPYEYLSPGKNGQPYEIISYGSSGKEGGGTTITSEDIGQ